MGAVLAVALPANADGGAYIELDRTFYPSGSTAHAEAYVSVPERHQDALDRGPFYAYLVPYGSWLTAGKRLPSGTVRLGTFSIEDLGRNAFELSTSFPVPDVDTGLYYLQLCNDPCTVVGFREALSGFFTVAPTAAEAHLLADRTNLEFRVAGFRHQVGRLKRANQDLEARLEVAVAERDDLRARLADVAGPALAATSAAPAVDQDRPLIDPWALVAIVVALLVALTSVGLGIAFGRRPAPRLVVPDTIAELEDAEALARR
jgi:hypothetical protein